MKCPGCASEMTDMSLEGRLGSPVEFDVCTACQAFWFDMYKSPQLSSGSTLQLMKFISDHPPTGALSKAENLRCPRCGGRLLLTHDIGRASKFTYWRCEQEHGRFIGFVDFLREKDFIHPLSPQQIKELRQNVQIVNCSNCGAPIDLAVGSVCEHCGSPLSILDMKQPQRLLQELKGAQHPIDEKRLMFDLTMAKLEGETSLSVLRGEPDWIKDVSTTGLVHACLSAVARWIENL